MKSLLDKSFNYVPSKDMGPDYLALKFKRMQREQSKQESRVVVNVRPIKKGAQQ